MATSLVGEGGDGGCRRTSTLTVDDRRGGALDASPAAPTGWGRNRAAVVVGGGWREEEERVGRVAWMSGGRSL